MITVSQTIIDELNEVLDDLGDNKSIPPSYEKYKNMDALEKILKFFKDEDKVLIRKEMA
jgi:hypothetical protein